jgi:outer membrane lipoprotein-sorting protein
MAMKSMVNRLRQFLLFTFYFLLLILLLHRPAALAQDGELKPGDTIGPSNWRRVEDMVAPHLLNRIKGGLTFQIKPPKIYTPPKEYLEATEKYSAQVRLGANGELLNYVAGLPFPKIDGKDPQAGPKLAWNFYWRWLGDDFKTGGATKEGTILRLAIERDGSERRADLVSYTIFPRTRYTLPPKPAIPGYEHIDWSQIRIDSYPRDTSGTTTLEFRYADPNRPDDLYLYIPSIRRIRRATTTQRCQTLAPSEFTLDDINSFNAKITDFNYKLLGEKKVLTNFEEQGLPFRRKPGDYVPLDEKWEVQEVYVLEITPKDPSYCYPKKIVWVDKVTWESVSVQMWDRKGEYWKETFAFRTPVKLPDGREVWSVGTVVIHNVQNGRTTLVTAVRSYNKGYPASMWSLATLQKIMRGGTIE